MTTYQILCLAGIPTITSFFVGFMISYFTNTRKQVKALKLGLQALLRDRLHQAYGKFKNQGYCSISDKENFENMYKQYHSLGQNGVMDEFYEEVKKMPTNSRS